MPDEMERMPKRPIMPPVEPKDPKVRALAHWLCQACDMFMDRNGAMAWADILQAIEWARYRITEMIIAKHNAKRGR